MVKTKYVVAILFFWLIILFGFIGFKEFTKQTGTEVLLKTMPIDPRDLFRGDYVVLRYDISTVSSDLATENLAIGDKVYVSLVLQDQYAIASSVSKMQPSDSLFVKAKVKNVNPDHFELEYGIESYFVPEGKGRDIERYRGNQLDVKVAIDQFGNAVIKSLLIEGKEVSLS